MNIMCVIYVYWSIHMLYRSFMVGRASGSGWGRVNRGSMIYPLALVLHPPLSLRSHPSLPPLLLPPPLLVMLYIFRNLLWYLTWACRVKASVTSWSTVHPTNAVNWFISMHYRYMSSQYQNVPIRVRHIWVSL